MLMTGDREPLRSFLGLLNPPLYYLLWLGTQAKSFLYTQIDMASKHKLFMYLHGTVL